MADINKESEGPGWATHSTTGPGYIRHLTESWYTYHVHTQHSNEFTRLEKKESFQERRATGCTQVHAQKGKMKGAKLSRNEKRCCGKLVISELPNRH